MRHIVKLRESDFHRLVRNIIMEDGATSCGGVYDTAMSDGTYEGGEAQRKQVTDVPLGGVVRRPSVVGEPKGEKKDTLENDALKRKDGVGGSISVNQVESVERGEINEINWKSLALGGMMAMSSPQAAQAGNDNGNIDWNGRHHKTGQKFDNMSIYDSGNPNAKKDTIYWNDVKQVTPQMKSRLRTYYNNAKILFNSQEKSPFKGLTAGEDFKRWIKDGIKDADRYSMTPGNRLAYLTVVEIDGSSETSLINSIQEIGLLPNLAPNNNYYGVFKGGNGKWYLFGLPGSGRGDYFEYIKGLQH